MAVISQPLVRDCEAAELATLRAWHGAIPAPLAGDLGLGHLDLGGGVMVRAAADVLAFNRVLGLGMAQPATERDLDEAIAYFDHAGARRFMVQVAPGATPAEFVPWLEARGFYRHNHWMRLARDLAAPFDPPRTDLRVTTFGAAHAETFGRIVQEAYGYAAELARMNASLVGRPGWRFFGAFDGDTLVSVSALHLDGPTAWFGFGSTRASHRGRGAQSALIAARLDAARAAGCRWASVESAADTPEKPNSSAHNLRRLGFRDLYERPNWVKVLREG